MAARFHIAALFEFMDSLLKILKILLLATLVMGQSGCATSDDDLNYTRKTIDTSGDTSYHGWSAPPKEVDPSLEQ